MKFMFLADSAIIK